MICHGKLAATTGGSLILTDLYVKGSISIIQQQRRLKNPHIKVHSKQRDSKMFRDGRWKILPDVHRRPLVSVSYG